MEQLPPMATCRPLVQVVFPLFTTKSGLMVRAGLPRVSVLAVLLISVMVVMPLSTPTGSLPKLTELGRSRTLLVPTPLMPAVCGLVGSLSLIRTAPFLAPVDLGVKVRRIWQLFPPPRGCPDAGQLLDLIAKSLVSFSVMAPMVTALVPLFVTVTVLGPLVGFTNWVPKLMGTPESVIAVPIPVRLTVEAGLKKPLSLMETVPRRLPALLGEK